MKRERLRRQQKQSEGMNTMDQESNEDIEKKKRDQGIKRKQDGVHYPHTSSRKKEQSNLQYL